MSFADEAFDKIEGMLPDGAQDVVENRLGIHDADDAAAAFDQVRNLDAESGQRLAGDLLADGDVDAWNTTGDASGSDPQSAAAPQGQTEAPGDQPQDFDQQPYGQEDYTNQPGPGQNDGYQDGSQDFDQQQYGGPQDEYAQNDGNTY